MIYACLALFFLLIVAGDQLSKYLVVKSIPLGGIRRFLPGLLHWTHVRNDGMSFSLLSGARWFFVGVTLLVMALCIYLIWKKLITHPIGLFSIAAVMGGAVGNLIDRIRLGYVVDMIEVEFIRFAVFNVADIFVVCGGILLAVYGIFIWKDPKDKEKEQAAKPEENRDETNS